MIARSSVQLIPVFLITYLAAGHTALGFDDKWYVIQETNPILEGKTTHILTGRLLDYRYVGKAGYPGPVPVTMMLAVDSVERGDLNQVPSTMEVRFSWTRDVRELGAPIRVRFDLNGFGCGETRVSLFPLVGDRVRVYANREVDGAWSTDAYPNGIRGLAPPGWDFDRVKLYDKMQLEAIRTERKAETRRRWMLAAITTACVTIPALGLAWFSWLAVRRRAADPRTGDH